MAEAARLGDRSHVPADRHHCKHCAHSAIGPAASGAPDVLINDRAAVRVGDTGVHASCCGPNTWEAVQGAPRVLINGRRAHRRGDVDRHCGGMGKMVEGSPDVRIGDHVGDEATGEAAPRIVLKDIPGPIGIPLINTPWVLLLDWKVVERGKTDDEGRVEIRSRLRPGRIYELAYPGRTVEIVGGTAPIETIRGMQVRLSALGYHPGPITGRANARTTAALVQFQIDHGLPPDGVYEASCWGALQALANF